MIGPLITEPLDLIFEDPAHRDVPVKSRSRITSALDQLFDDLVDIAKPHAIIEVGAFEAAFSVRAKRRHPAATVIALEANPRVFEHFAPSLRGTGVDYRHTAAGSREGTAVIHIPEVIANTAMPAIGRMASLHPVALHGSRTVSAEVPMRPLDAIVRETTGPLALWIDVEGAIAEVLEGSAEALRRAELIVCELESSPVWHNQTLDAPIRARFAEAGFVLIARDCQKWFQYNAIFARPAFAERRSVATRVARYRNTAIDLWREWTPPRLFQYWHGDERPDDVSALMAGWRADPSFQYQAFTRETALELLRANFRPRFAEAFRKARAPAMQADLFRVAAMALYGGIYIDADVENRHRNDVLLDRSGRGYLFHRRANLANDVMVVHRPLDALPVQALRHAVKNIEEGRGETVWEMTGPGILTNLYNKRGGGDALFAGFRFGTVEELRELVGFHWDLPYKDAETDWRRMKAAELIAP